MKLTQIFVFSCMVALFSSCDTDEYLTATAYGSFDEATFYASKDAGQKVVTWCYKPMDDHWSFNIARLDIGSKLFDDCDKGGSDVNDRIQILEVARGNPLSTNTTLSERYSWSYLGIGRCNVALENLTKEEVQLIDAAGNSIPESLKARFISEVKFLRAFYYFDLVSVFGAVPLLTTTPLVTDQYSLTRASIEDIRTQMLLDIDACINDINVPQASELPTSELGRITRDVALSFKSRVCLFFAGLMEHGKMTGDTNAEYALARDAANTVIQKGYFELLPDFQELFRGDYITGPQSKECIFTNLRNRDTGFGLGGLAVPIMNSGRNAVGGWGGACPTVDLVNEFEEGDGRKMFTVVQHGDIFVNKAGGDVVHNYTGYDNPSGYHSRKDFVPSPYRLSGEDLQSTRWCFYLIRYPEVLLNYAEALLKTGGDKQAIVDALNEIRKRAFVTTSRVDEEAKLRNMTIPAVTEAEFDATYAVKTTDDLEAAIRHERRMELALEGHRFTDLIRWNNYVEIMQAYTQKSMTQNGFGAVDPPVSYAVQGRGAQVKASTWPYPIPQTEIDRTAGSITQNPGY